MAGNARFESSPANVDDLTFVGSHSNVQKGNHSGASLDRSGSFRETSEGRMFNSSTSNLSRGSSPFLGDMPSISQYLVLEPFVMVDQKYPKSSELRKLLGIPPGISAEGGSSGANHTKLPHLVVGEELRRFKSNVVNASVKARTRLKMFDESLHKLNKYCETLNSKKQQRSELLMNERSGGPNLKMNSQLQHNSADLLAHKLEDRTKNSSLNMRFRSSLAEPRSVSQGNMRQSFVMGKDCDLGGDGNEGSASDAVEEKIRRLPAGGEGWEKKMKRKRSMGNVFARPVEEDREMKKATQKLKNGPNPLFSDTQVLRSRSSMNGAGGMNKSDICSMPPGSKIRRFSKNEQKASVQRDCSPSSLKDRALVRGNTKLPTREEASMQNPTPLIKGKASRAPRSGLANSPTSLPRASEGLESWEHPSSVPKVHLLGVTNNRKRTLPSGPSSSPSMTQWGMQRPQKMPRSRRANVVSPVLSNDEIPNSSEGFMSDLGPKITSMSRGFASGIQQLKVKLDNVSSPARLPESEESGARESNDSRLKEKRTSSNEVEERDVVLAQNVGCSVGKIKKSKIVNRDEMGDSATREGRSGRSPSFARAGSSPLREKLENVTCSKPQGSMRASSDKSGRKSGRPPLKKLSDRKAFNRPGKSPGVSTPDFSGESDDDREELLSAASCASSASYSACTVNFWKKVEIIFASICLEDISYLEQQIKSLKEFHKNLPKKFNNDNLKDILEHEENVLHQNPVHGARDDNSQIRYSLKESTGSISLAEDNIVSICGRLDTGAMEIIPITQRLLAALIVEDEAMIGGDREGLDNPFQHADDNLIFSLPVNGNSKDSSYGSEYDYHFLSDPQIHDQLSVGKSYCNGFMSKNLCSQPNQGYGQLHTERVFEKTENSYGYDDHYVRIVERRAFLELHSIGLYPENVPNLEDGEDDQINKEISDLHKKLIQKVDMKKACVNHLIEAVRKEVQKNGRDLEQIAMEKYIESAHKKQLATRATYASKYGIPKVPKHVATAFTKRALARFHNFEDTGKSCFSESPFIEALSVPPPRWEESMEYSKLDTTSNAKPESKVAGPLAGRVVQHDPHNNYGSFESSGPNAKIGPLPNRGKKREVLLDDIGGKPSSLKAQPNRGNAFSGGAKGKRSERDRDKDQDPQAKNAKTDRPINSKGERKTKAKPKQRTAQVSTSVSGFISNSLDVKRDTAGSIPGDGNISSNTDRGNKESVDFASLDLPIDPIDDLDVPGWLSFDGDGLLDIDSAGLEIPMDDLSDVFV
ncbi:hypothetical protein SAY87_027723 [Trapa incisa]|uniref:Uncharacterized protein n=1 Tax=Trapa incisa TaxID=236973 RepID=A0AAN7PKP7_9MYRT|nr:hypothetical protein SAY87_027723 [Trapa incisa]